MNARYGNDAGVLFYTHVSDQYAPFHTQVIHATVRDATYVLDGLLYHEADLRIEEHYTDTAGFTDYVFALMHLLGFRFAPRIRDLADKRLYIDGPTKRYPTLAPLIGGTIHLKHIRAQWDEVLRLASSIRQGTVTASQVLREERAELDGPAPHGLVGDLDSALSQQLLHVAMAERKAVVEPDRVRDDLRWKAVPVEVARAVRHRAALRLVTRWEITPPT